MSNVLSATGRKLSDFQRGILRLANYNAVGFDLGNTLCEFSICELAEAVYHSLGKYLIENKQYDRKLLGHPLGYAGKDFTQRGLLFDVVRGNVLKVLEDGFIAGASHGTEQMSDERIRATYGSKRHWSLTDGLAKDITTLWAKENRHSLFTSLNYFGMASVTAYASAVRTVDDYMQQSLKYPRIAQNVLQALDNIMVEDFSGGSTELFLNIKNHPERFYRPSSREVLDWLSRLVKQKFVFLLTSSEVDFASYTLKHTLGSDWEKYFSAVVFNVHKGSFFTSSKPFLGVDGLKETKPLSPQDLLTNKHMSQGNWALLRDLISQKTGKPDPICLFVGDDVIEDIVLPSLYAKMDTVAIVRELEADHPDHPDKDCLISKKWGPFLYEPKTKQPTLWAKIINKYATLSLPSFEAIKNIEL